MDFHVFVFVLPLLCIVNSQKNLSPNGTASQKSTYRFFNRHAKLAITGGPTNDWNSGSCSTTSGTETSTWWKLTFPVNTVYFTEIKIWYRDNTPDRLAGYFLYVSNTTSITNAYLCYHDEGPDLPSVNQTNECNHLGKHVIIYNERKSGVLYPYAYSAKAWLELCDVQVYGCYKTLYGDECERRCSEKCVDQHCYPGNGSCVWGCNCLHNNCDNSTICTEGCEKRFAGQYCHQYNVASNGSATQHPSPGSLQANLAIDGDRTVRACSKTTGPRAWWQVDLGGLTAIKAVYVTFNIIEKQNARDHSIYLTTTSGSWSFEIKLNMTTDFETSFPSLTYIVNPVLLGRYLIYVPKENNIGIAVVDICEVEVVGCPTRRYGQDCNQTCPVNCLGSCHPDTGICSFGCYDGWKGLLCRDKCGVTKFGKNCHNTCYCAYYPCNHVNGTCPNGGCKAGWEGSTCSTACRQGYFGKDCVETCDGCVNEICNRFSGICTITGTCKPGWTGQKCDQACAPGTFGLKCAYVCHCLNNNPTCNHVTGTCPAGGCKRGYSRENCSTECGTGKFGFNCNESCDGCLMNSCEGTHGVCRENGCKPGLKTNNRKCNIACDDGYFGDCSHECFCLDGVCDKSTGMCQNRQCAHGWKGDTCSQECDSGTHGVNCGSRCVTCLNTTCERFEGNCTEGCIGGYSGHQCHIQVIQHVDGSASPVAAIVGGIAALILLICLAVVAVMYRIRRNPKNTNHQNYEDTQFTAKSVENLYSNTDDSEEYSEIYINEDWVTHTDSIPMSVMPNKYGKVEHVTRNKALPVNSKNVAHKIQVKDLQNIINEKRKNNGAGFEDEFKRISEGAIRPDTEGTKEENKAKIGCMSAVPYEHARVILRGDTTSDYINACFIGNYYDDKAYIATQAPMPNTIKDFWHMVWQDNVDVIVMMTTLQEDGMSKCEQYWPESLTKPLTVGSYKVYLVQEKRDTNHVYRMMKIFSKTEKIEKAVNHFQFTHWPNNGIPDIIKLIGFYRKVKRTKTNGPVIVHCSTGVGRTGTFIALGVLYENGVKTGHVDPIGYITMMRKAQMNMIQTKEQYAAILEALLEIFTVPDTSVDRDSFYTYAEKDSQSLRREFQKLIELKPSYRDDFFRAGKTKENASKNVFTNILPHDQFRPLLESFEMSRNDYINAVVIPRFKENGEYIVTQYPLKHTVVDFWTMVYDKGCTIVVLLEAVTATVPLWPKFGDIFDFEKINLRRNEDSSLSLKNVVIHYKNSNETRTVSVISIDEWNRNDVPTSLKYMLNLLSSVSSWTEQHPGSIAVVCQDGCRRSGVFVALSLIFEKMDIDDDIDIFQVMRTIQIRRPEFISTFNQYEYCYKCIKEYLDDSM